MISYYIIKHNSKVFKPNTIVKFETCSNSGDCYLVSDLNNTYNREWIMYYDLYPIDKNKIINTRFYFDEKFNKIAEEFLNNSIN